MMRLSCSAWGEADISNKTLNAICGHAPASEGDKYGVPTLKTMATAMEKFPRYKIGLEEDDVE